MLQSVLKNMRFSPIKDTDKRKSRFGSWRLQFFFTIKVSKCQYINAIILIHFNKPDLFHLQKF